MTKTEYARIYRDKNKKKVSDYQKKWESNNKELRHSLTVLWREKNREKLRDQNNKYNKDRRIKLLWMLGGQCVKCGFSDSRALQIDHVNGNGNGNDERRDRKFLHTYGSWIKALTERKENYQILCANCNWIKRDEMKEYGKRSNKVVCQ